MNGLCVLDPVNEDPELSVNEGLEGPAGMFAASESLFSESRVAILEGLPEAVGARP